MLFRSKDSIINLLNDKFIITKSDLFEKIINSNIINKDQIIDYLSHDDIHSTLNVTFFDIFIKVYGRIINSEFKDELFKRLDEEMSDAECKCFTGRLTRLVNVLNGYYDDIIIQISSNEQISNIIINIKNKYNLSNEDEISDKIKDEIRQQLKEYDYDDKIINLWVDNI